VQAADDHTTSDFYEVESEAPLTDFEEGSIVTDP
jgi:hypothetical protein